MLDLALEVLNEGEEQVPVGTVPLTLSPRNVRPSHYGDLHPQHDAG